jgi:hypothetical protein
MLMERGLGINAFRDRAEDCIQNRFLRSASKLLFGAASVAGVSNLFVAEAKNLIDAAFSSRRWR